MGMGVLRDPAWREWYHAQHQQRAQERGTAFEKYATAALALKHPDFVDPDPAGRLGDWGCDGLAESGTTLYACYGARPTDSERELRKKVEADFTRAAGKWPAMRKWRFVTNATVGPITSQYLTDLQRAHEPTSERSIEIQLMRPDHLWTDIVSGLDPTALDHLFPGVPHEQHVELADIVVLLDALGDGSEPDTLGGIREVPPTKMAWNDLSGPVQLEFNEGRLSHPRIDAWFAGQADPDLRDRHGAAFRKVYDEHRQLTSDARELLERVYLSVGGSDFRLDGRRANAVYAVTSYFFDSCYIFDEPPSGYAGGPHRAPAE